MNKPTIIILAGGSGKRFGMAKQFVPIHNIPVFIYTLKKFEGHSIVLTVPKLFKEMTQNIVDQNNIKILKLSQVE
jgi:2-C-methyl-D-erythritol 4-phosphate cytidylyltransferase